MMGSRMLGHDRGSVARRPEETHQSFQQITANLDRGPLSSFLYISPHVSLETLGPNVNNISKASLLSEDQTDTNVRFRYRERVRRFAEKWPQADSLVEYLDNDWTQPGARLQAAFTNIYISNVRKGGKSFTSEVGCSDLRDERNLQNKLLDAAEDTCLRYIVIPDISPVVVGLLGETFDINPLVFVTALQNLWKLPETGAEILDLQSHEEGFRNSLFSYESATDFSSDITFSCNRFPNDEIHSILVSQELIESVDASLMQQDCKDKFESRALSSFHSILCPPIRTNSIGTAGLRRHYQATNRLTCFKVPKSQVATFLLFTTPSNDWSENDQYQHEVAKQGSSLPRWVGQLAARIAKLCPMEIVDIQTRDNGNPFFSLFLGESSSTERWWKELPGSIIDQNKDSMLKHYYTRDIKAIFAKFYRSPTESMFAIEVWASSRVIKASEDVLAHSRARMTRFKANSTLYKSITFAERIKILRDHRNILENSRDRVDKHIRKFKVSSLHAMHISKNLQREYQQEVELMLLRLQEILMGMQAVVRTNEQLIQDTLFDLQLELTNMQLAESRRSIEQNATMKRLTTLAFIFIPVSTVAGIFGMNVQGLADTEPWVFLVTALLLVFITMLGAGYRHVKALMSAAEAIAYRHSRQEKPSLSVQGTGMISTKKSSIIQSVKMYARKLQVWTFVLSAKACVAMFALWSLFLVPFQLANFLLHGAIEYGVAQEEVHRRRRIQVDDAWARSMVRESILNWRIQKQHTVWYNRFFWEAATIPALAYAYILHRLDPIV